MDRGYATFALFNSIVQSQTSCVCRLRDSTVCQVAQERTLSAAAIKADVLCDQVVLLGKTSKIGGKLNHAIRLIQMRCTPHHNRTGGKTIGSTDPNSDGVFQIAMNLLVVPAEIIALICSRRWIIGVFNLAYP
ncbi:hypothetical protein Pla52n_18150 [Stieleria varia]|uniref:Transposase DDE domain protein n=2 Tax=Stieleria varia TaxID=2528005 RepID=A0A5C6B1A4_9BACT|nr:hypothetical protein Pla52n_18150 [Stieleria varia]